MMKLSFFFFKGNGLASKLLLSHSSYITKIRFQFLHFFPSPRFHLRIFYAFALGPLEPDCARVTGLP